MQLRKQDTREFLFFCVHSYSVCAVWGGEVHGFMVYHIPMLRCHSCSILHKSMNPSMPFLCWGSLYLHVLLFYAFCSLEIMSQLHCPFQIVAVKKQMRDVRICRSSPCWYLWFKLLDHQEAQPHWLFFVCIDPFWIVLIFIYIETDPQLIDPEDIVRVIAGLFLDFTGSLLSENSTEEWNRTIWDFVLCVSLCLL